MTRNNNEQIVTTKEIAQAGLEMCLEVSFSSMNMATITRR
jgi:hypothetical protein